MKISKKIHMFILFVGFLVPAVTPASEDPDELYKQGRFSEAEKAYAAKDMDHPKDIRYRYNRGCAAYQNSDYQGARAAFSSVMRRTGADGVMSSRERADEIHFKAAYNLGNTAFKKGDFESAAAHYKKAIIKNPESNDAKHNLELALRELEKSKKNKSPEGGSAPQKDTRQPGDKRDQSKTEENGQDQDKESHPQDQRNDKEKAAQGEPETSEQTKGTGEDAVKKDEPDSIQDLSGTLDSLRDMPDQKQDNASDQSGSLLDRKKAEALLDNLKEDRSRFLRFQIPEDKKRGVQSGKDW